MKYTLFIFSLISSQLFAGAFSYTTGKHLDVDFEECIDAQKDGFKILSIDKAPTYLNFYYHDDFLYKFQSFPEMASTWNPNDSIKLKFYCAKYKING